MKITKKSRVNSIPRNITFQETNFQNF